MKRNYTELRLNWYYLLLMLFGLEITTFIHMTRLSSIDQLRARRAVA